MDDPAFFELSPEIQEDFSKNIGGLSKGVYFELRLVEQVRILYEEIEKIKERQEVLNAVVDRTPKKVYGSRASKKKRRKKN